MGGMVRQWFYALKSASTGGNPHHPHHHDFAQQVLPVCDRMEIDVDGLGGCIDQSLTALVTLGTMHSQLTHSNSRFLVLDCAVFGKQRGDIRHGGALGHSGKQPQDCQFVRVSSKCADQAQHAEASHGKQQHLVTPQAIGVRVGGQGVNRHTDHADHADHADTHYRAERRFEKPSLLKQRRRFKAHDRDARGAAMLKLPCL